MAYFPVFDDERFREELEILNCFCPGYKWEPTTARKSHEDEFGETIESGDVYYSRRGESWNDTLRLSRKSMDTLLYVVTNGNGVLHHLGKQILERDRRRFEDALEKATRPHAADDPEDEPA